MKKIFALAVLFAASAAAVFILIVVNLLFIYSPAFPAALINAAAVSFGISCLYGLLERRFSINRNVFWLAAYLPVLACAVLDLVKAYYDSIVLNRFYMGPGAVLLFYDIPITCGVYGLFGTGWLVVFNVITKRKTGV